MSDQQNLDGIGGSLPAQTSANTAEKELERLRDLLASDGGRQWEVGDCLINLIDRHGYKLTDLAKEFGLRKGTLSMLYTIAKMYPAESRDTSIPYVTHRLGAYAIKKVQRAEFLITGEKPTIDAGTVVRMLHQSGVRDKRAAMRTVQNFMRSQRKSSASSPVTIESDDQLVNRCHNVDCVQLAARFSPASAAIIHLDPPYANYRKHDDGQYEMQTRDINRRTDCDNNTSDTAVATTVAAIKAYAPILAKNGAMLLWQASNILRAPIHQAILESGLVPEICVIWDKGIPQPGDPATAWTYQCEFMYVLKREGDYLANHDGSNRGNVVKIGRTNQAGHIFEKPLALCELLIGKHTGKGDLVIDAYGCSGVFCVAAHKLGRQWVYIESNEMNFNWGAERVYGVTQPRHSADETPHNQKS